MDTRRGRPYADLDGAEIVRLRDEEGMSWRRIAKRFNADVRTLRRAYTRHRTTSKCGEIRSTPWQKSVAAIPEVVANSNSTPAAAQARESAQVGPTVEEVKRKISELEVPANE